MKKIKPVTPGEMLEEEFLKPLGLTKYRLAKDIGVPPQRIGDIVAGKRAITADTDLAETVAVILGICQWHSPWLVPWAVARRRRPGLGDPRGSQGPKGDDQLRS